ncbi:hypothetical protein RvY_12569 [Ramazzottius varieornatus]|uniref:Uncharacterized protein n=1 Tax=Ramazzottius varieornatus TaxID=947166 RepID=A0A1D1VJZ8_RAMVA|nr:hypothetical protein RvY_12569 [Ramazzottius varieornatus]
MADTADCTQDGNRLSMEWRRRYTSVKIDSSQLDTLLSTPIRFVLDHKGPSKYGYWKKPLVARLTKPSSQP